MEHIRFKRILLGVALILSIPLFAMVFRVEGWDWDFFDFILMGALISCFGVAYEYFAPRLWGGTHRLAVGALVLSAFVLTWASLID
jgi:hypothetical protein